MNDAIKKYAGVDFDTVSNRRRSKGTCKRKQNIEFEDRHTKGDIVNLFFEEYLRREVNPAYIHYGSSNCNFPTYKEETKQTLRKVERFELFINTWEMCNAYSELNDPIDQRERFKAAG